MTAAQLAAQPPGRLTLVGMALALLCAGALTIPSAAGWPPHGVGEGTRLAVGALAFALAWSLMVGAMMLPSALPFLEALSRVGGGRAVALGALGFWTAWLLAGAAFAGLLLAAGEPIAALPPGGVERLAAAILLVAALYQLSPLAKVCQRACRSPFGLMARYWRGTRIRAARAGLAYGGACVGCCVPMIAVMALVGMADARWVFALAALTLALKHPVWGAAIAPLSAVALAAAALLLGSGAWVPALQPLRVLCGG